MGLVMVLFLILRRLGAGMFEDADAGTESEGEGEEDQSTIETRSEDVAGPGIRGGAAIGPRGSVRGKERESGNASSGKERGRRRENTRGSARPRDGSGLRSTDATTIDARNALIAMTGRDPQSASIERIKNPKRSRRRRRLHPVQCHLFLHRSRPLHRNPLWKRVNTNPSGNLQRSPLNPLDVTTSLHPHPRP